MDKNERIWLVGVGEEEGEGCQWPMCDLWLCGRRGVEEYVFMIYLG